MNARVLCLASSVALAVVAADAQPRPYSPGPPARDPGLSMSEDPVFEFHLALTWVKRAAEELDERWGDRLGAEMREELVQIQEAAEFLQVRWRSWAADRGREPVYLGRVRADPYYRSLRGYHRRLRQVLRSDDVSEVERAIVEVAADMRLKASNCLHSEDGLGKDIAVRVRTLREAEEVGGYEVWCVPRALLEFEELHLRFPKLSSPSLLPNLSPGNYLIWVRKDEVTSDRVPQRIGGEGQTDLEVELVVP